MVQATQRHSRSIGVTQAMAVHMIASAARILLLLSTALLVGDMVARPAKKLLEARHQRAVNEDGEPAD